MRAHECWSGMVPGDVREEDCCGICGREADSLNHLSPEAAKVAGVDMICEDCTQRTFGYYRIVSQRDDRRLYWSNFYGWVDRDDADLFNGPVNLPMGYTELEYSEDPEEVAPCLVCGEPKPNREACPTCQEAEKEAQA